MAESLKQQGKLLRIRRTPSAQTLTYNGPISAASKLKHREEIECRIEDADVVGQPVTTDQLDLLGPDGTRLRVEVAHHRLVGHLPGLGIEVGHAGRMRTRSSAVKG